MDLIQKIFGGLETLGCSVGEESKTPELIQAPGDSEAGEVEPQTGEIIEAIVCTEAPYINVPGTTTHDT